MRDATYASSGVDIEKMHDIDYVIKKLVQSTYNEHTITAHGLFGGGMSLEKFKNRKNLTLGASLGFQKVTSVDPEKIAREIYRKARSRMKGFTPFSFLDYIAAAHLSTRGLTQLISSYCNETNVPIIGGETAEMPGVFFDGMWESVGVLFGLGEGEGVDLSFIRDLESPSLIMSIDGVGTKTKLAVQAKNTQGLIEDIVNHSLGDILCMRAKGIGMTIYLGCHAKNSLPFENPEKAFADYLRKKGMHLLDFIIHDKPELYPPFEVDLVGSIAGIRTAYTPSRIKEGDKLIGLYSNGIHTNGFSLIRKVLQDPLIHASSLLTPHKDYSEKVLPILNDCKALAHITGGGIPGNLVRVLPDDIGAVIDKRSWEVPSIFHTIQKAAETPMHDPVKKGMFDTFNMGIGLILIVDLKDEEKVLDHLQEEAVCIGKTVKDHEKNVTFKD